ncbi:MAG: hypothetical protein AAFQ94_30835 [Bacteroidota bacterium]
MIYIPSLKRHSKSTTWLKPGLSIAFLFFMLSTLLFYGCQVKTQTDNASLLEEEVVSNVHLAFAGGGWRAHTAHSGWTIALTEKGKYKLGDIYNNVGTVSSNSGGSWFSTMLMYSNDFISDIESAEAVNTWATSSGWIGKQRKWFDAVSTCSDVPDYIYLECVFDHYTNTSYTGGTHWKKVVDNLIFKDYPLSGVTLSDQKQNWAKDKPLLLASTLLTNSVVLNESQESGNYHNYYQVCFEGGTPQLNGDSGSNCSNFRPVDVAAATFSSIPPSVDYKPSPLFPKLESGNTAYFNIGYTVDYVVESAPTHDTIITSPLSTANLEVMTAAAASSAAVGFGASQYLVDFFDIAWTFEDDAVSFSLANESITYKDAQGMSLKDLAYQKMVRMADGGPADNSAVAQLVRSLQINNQANGFNIVAFDNVTGITVPGKGLPAVGIDIASLFGYKDQLCITEHIFDKEFKYCLTTPELQIFESGPLYATPQKWSYGKGSTQLVYTPYQVTTIENPALGIKAGTTGTVHAFTCVYGDAATAPTDGDSDFNAYENMFDFINVGLDYQEQEGLIHLRRALGLQ